MTPTTKDMIRTPNDERAASEGYYYDHDAASRVDRFFAKYLRHSKGQWAGKPFALLDWQRDGVIYPLFGWKRPDGTRRFRRAYMSVAKKNGKSALCSGISLYMLAGDGEPGAEVYCAAADREQASIVYNEAANMIQASPQLSKHMQVVKSQKRVNYPARHAWYKALSSDAPTKEGINWHALIFDELHAQPSRELWEALEYGGVARRQPLLVSITTAGYDRNSICYEQHQYAEAVEAGDVYDPSFFPYVCSPKADEDWTDPITWRKGNPSLGITVQESDLAAQCEEAKRVPRKQNAFRRYRVNQWVDQADVWIDLNEWDSCATNYTEDEMIGESCYAGLDLSTTTDLTSLSLFFPSSSRVLTWFWLPKETLSKRLDRESRDTAPYEQWIKDGYIKTTPGSALDYATIEADVVEICERFNCVAIAADRQFAQQMGQNLMTHGLDVGWYAQSMAMFTAPMKRVETMILNRTLEHDGHPVLRWNVQCAATKEDPSGRTMLDKSRSSGRIDGLVAMCMAIGRWLMDEKPGDSVYEERGIITL